MYRQWRKDEALAIAKRKLKHEFFFGDADCLDVYPWVHEYLMTHVVEEGGLFERWPEKQSLASKAGELKLQVPLHIEVHGDLEDWQDGLCEVCIIALEDEVLSEAMAPHIDKIRKHLLATQPERIQYFDQLHKSALIDISECSPDM